MKINKIEFHAGPSENPYMYMSQDELMRQFQSGTWDKISKEQKLELLEEVGSRYAAYIGVYEKPAFGEEANPCLYGGYCKGVNVVMINLSHAENPYQTLDTVAHEVNHAYQIQCIRLGDNTKYSEQELALLKAEDATYIQDGEGYSRQSLEVDSNNAGFRYVMQYKELFLEDKAFQDYLNNRREYFNSINQDYDIFRENCNISEYRQILGAYTTGHISDDEMLLAEDCILEGNNSIRAECRDAFQQAQEAWNELKAENSKEDLSLSDGLEFLNVSEIVPEMVVQQESDGLEFLGGEEYGVDSGDTGSCGMADDGRGRENEGGEDPSAESGNENGME